jgi:carbonic anhydrase/acetyltransferase-like protein (isoleucine patch superfamily)
LEEIIIESEESIDLAKIPITTNVFTWNYVAILLYLFLHIFSFLMPSVMILTFFNFALDSNFFHWRILLIGIDIFAWWGSYLFISLLLGKLTLIILKLIHTPKEGLFKIEKQNADYQFYCLRITVKKFIFWIWNNFCFPWVSNLAFKMCDMRADFKSTMFDGWSDVEFIEFGNNIMIGQGAQVFSSSIIRIENEDFLLIKKVIIGDHVVLGGNCIVSPGTIIGKSTTLGVWTVTRINQILEPDWIYIGNPARKYQPAQKLIEESKKEPIRRIVDTGEKMTFDVDKFVNKKE